MSQEKYLKKIVEERKRQDAKWGPDRNMHPATWLTILTEETGEVAKEICDSRFYSNEMSDNYEKELVQVAAVALAALENIHKYKKEGK